MTDPAFTGVQFNAPPPQLLPSLTKAVTEAAAALAPNQNGALVLVGTKKGDHVQFNAALVTKLGADKSWTVSAWVGKSWGTTVEGGTAVMKTW